MTVSAVVGHFTERKTTVKSNHLSLVVGFLFTRSKLQSLYMSWWSVFYIKITLNKLKAKSPIVLVNLPGVEKAAHSLRQTDKKIPFSVMNTKWS